MYEIGKCKYCGGELHTWAESNAGACERCLNKNPWTSFAVVLFRWALLITGLLLLLEVLKAFQP